MICSHYCHFQSIFGPEEIYRPELALAKQQIAEGAALAEHVTPVCPVDGAPSQSDGEGQYQ